MVILVLSLEPVAKKMPGFSFVFKPTLLASKRWADTTCSSGWNKHLAQHLRVLVHNLLGASVPLVTSHKAESPPSRQHMLVHLCVYVSSKKSARHFL